MSYPDQRKSDSKTSKDNGALGIWNNGSFQFHSPQHQSEWLKRAYRQSVNPEPWAKAPVVDRQTDAMLKALPEKVAGNYFVGPDGQYRSIGREQREASEVTDHRRQSVKPWLDTLPKKQQTTWQDLGDLPEDHPHPGEKEQVSRWMETYQGSKDQAPAVRVAEGPIFRFKPGIIDAPIVELEPRPALDGGGRSVGTTGGQSTVGGGTGKQPPVAKQPPAQGKATADAEVTRDNSLLTSLFGSNDDLLQAPPVLNSDTLPRERPYPPMPAVLDVSKPAPALGLTAEEMQDIPWMDLDQRLRAQDTYSPYNNQIPLRQQPLRSHTRSPLAAAQEALDAVHETHLAKGRDWNQELLGHPEAALAEFENALEATVSESSSIWMARKEGIPTAVEIEQMRQTSRRALPNIFRRACALI